MKIDLRFWTDTAKKRLRFIKKKWKSLSADSQEIMPYKKFRNEFLNEVGQLQNTRQKLIQIIGDRQLARARTFYNSIRSNN